MKRKIILFMAAILAVLMVSPLAVCAPNTRVEGVNYARIDESAGMTYPVDLNLGNLLFVGELARGKSLTPNEIDKIIDQVMDSKNITSGMLIYAHDAIKALDNVEGYNWNDILDALLDLTGAKGAVDLYNILMGTDQRTSTQIIEDGVLNYAEDKVNDVMESVVENALANNGAVKLGATTVKVGTKLLFLLPNLTKIGIDLVGRYEKIEFAAAEALEATIFLNDFYRECNKRIQQEAGIDENSVWKINFRDTTANHYFNMWGIGNLMSQWAITGELVQDAPIGAGTDAGVYQGSYAGRYNGDLHLEINGVDMENSFDNNFINTNTFWVKYWKDALDSEFAMSNITNGVTVLKRTVVWSVTATVPTGTGEFTPALNPLLKTQDDQIIYIDHTMQGYRYDVGDNGYAHSYDNTRVTASSLEFAQCANYVRSHGSAGGHPFDVTTPVATIPSPAEAGTAWTPLDNQPVIKIYVK